MVMSLLFAIRQGRWVLSNCIVADMTEHTLAKCEDHAAILNKKPEKAPEPEKPVAPERLGI
jgi:hypothetical protein